MDQNVWVSQIEAAIRPATLKRSLLFVGAPIDPDDLQRIRSALNPAAMLVGDCTTSGDPIGMVAPLKRPAAQWCWPRGDIDAVVAVGQEADIGLRLTATAFRRGVSRFVVLDPSLSTLRSVSPLLLAVRIANCRLRSFPRVLKTLVIWAGQSDIWLFEQFARSIVGARDFLYLRSGLRACKRAVHQCAEIGYLSGGKDAASNRSRTVFCIGTLGPGGSERQLTNIALEMVKRSPEKPLVACVNLSERANSFYRLTLQNVGIEVLDLGLQDGGGLAAGGKGTEAFEVLREASGLVPITIRRDLNLTSRLIGSDMLRYLELFLHLRPKVVHAFLDDANVKAGVAAMIAGVPKIVLNTRSVAPDNFLLHRSYMRPIYSFLLDHPNVVICNNSAAGAADYRRWLKRSKLHIEVIYNGIDFSAFSHAPDQGHDLKERLGVPADALVLGGVMRMTEEKQPILWARTAVEISRHLPNVHFIIAGDGPLRPKIETVFSKAGVRERVHLLGHAQDIGQVLNAFDLFLLTSRMEGLPNVLIEAQSVGVPVVTTPAGGAAETLSPGVTGLVAKDQSIASLVEACLQILADDKFRQELEANAPEFVRKRFSMEAMTDAVFKLQETSM